MKVKLLLAAGLVALAGSVAVFSGGTHRASAAPNPAVAPYLPYEQALAARYKGAEQTQWWISQNPEHLPICSASMFKREGGYSSAAALHAAVLAAPEKPACMADPHDTLYGPQLNRCSPVVTLAPVPPSRLGCSPANRRPAGNSSQSPSPENLNPEQCKWITVTFNNTNYYVCYYYMGADTHFPSSTGWQGAEVGCEVTDPSFYNNPNDSYTNPEHVTCTTSAVYPTSGNLVAWQEVGWMEGYGDGFETGNARKVFTESLECPGGGGTNCPVLPDIYQYSLTVGDYYDWRSRDYWNGSNDYMISDIFWGGSWVEMDASINVDAFCAQQGDPSGYCQGTEHVEVMANASTCGMNTQNNTKCPTLGGSGITQAGTQLRYAPGKWETWSSSILTDPKSVEAPYETCWYSYYDSFLGYESTSGC